MAIICLTICNMVVVHYFQFKSCILRCTEFHHKSSDQLPPRYAYIMISTPAPITLFVNGLKFHNFFSPKVVVAVINHLLFRLSSGRSIPQIFAIKVERCQKSLRMLEVFALPILTRAGLTTSVRLACTQITIPASRHVFRSFARLYFY